MPVVSSDLHMFLSLLLRLAGMERKTGAGGTLFIFSWQHGHRGGGKGGVRVRMLEGCMSWSQGVQGCGMGCMESQSTSSNLLGVAQHPLRHYKSSWVYLVHCLLLHCSYPNTSPIASPLGCLGSLYSSRFVGIGVLQSIPN